MFGSGCRPALCNTRGFEQLRERWELLSELYKAGIDVTESQKLSAKQIEISKRIGDECKAGRLQANDRDDFQVLIGTGQALEQRFAATRLDRGLFILVYNPFLSPTVEVDQGLAESDVRTIPITDMRGKVIDLVKELSAT